ncbi:MAG: type IV toxin-antitoxin system AbiEi family antitoxin [Coriobacteriia bacterium]|nr:type IV toxin-antitoxin system AbiEi family antitoxin [Coriobacteriia bacterium]
MGLLETLQSQGRYSFTEADAREMLLRSDPAVSALLRRLKQKGRIVAPRRGFYVIVTPEYSTAGAPPPTWYVDDLMHHLGQPYYVGLLSAAAMHGATHQQPMRYQVLTDQPTRASTVGRSVIEFHVSTSIAETPTRRLQTETGTLLVSTREATALDLVRFVRASGGLGNVATVLGELAEEIDPDQLAAFGSLRPSPDLQRLGYLLDAVGHTRLANPLLRLLSERRVRSVLLDAGGPRKGDAVRPWRVIPNESVEVDE